MVGVQLKDETIKLIEKAAETAIEVFGVDKSQITKEFIISQALIKYINSASSETLCVIDEYRELILKLLVEEKNRQEYNVKHITRKEEDGEVVWCDAEIKVSAEHAATKLYTSHKTLEDINDIIDKLTEMEK